jgi:hypothetical protein
MRGAVLMIFVAACTADIAPGTYLCGPEQLCPPGQVCNGEDNTCVLANQQMPFSCNSSDPTGDDAPSAGQVIGNLTCVSVVQQIKGCLLENDPADWYQFDIPDNCNAVQIEARVTFPIAFEPVVMQASSENGSPSVADTPCKTELAPESGNVARCFKLTVANSSHHAIGLAHEGDANCNGACSNNRYTLALQLSTP